MPFMIFSESDSISEKFSLETVWCETVRLTDFQGLIARGRG